MSEQEPAEPGPPPPAVASGNPRVDAALAPLPGLEDTPVEDHPTVIEDIHRALQDILAEEQE
jgi:hypothetical protein